jgi:tRNA pseudouridine55 synthase
MSTNGFVLVDKPEGPTSHDVINMVRHRMSVRRIGHTGTLDPFASGLLIVVVGSATRLARFVDGTRKRYEGEIRLGTTTTTDDRTGDVVGEPNENIADETAVRGAMHALTGNLMQRPPAFSAKKVDGKRAYRLARRGNMPALNPVPVVVEEFVPLEIDGNTVHFAATVSAGTYIRALARDLGAAIGCGGHLHSLRRVGIGPFDVREAVAPDAVDLTMVLPARGLVGHLDSVVLDAAAADHVRHGRPIPMDKPLAGPVALVEDDVLVAVAEPNGEVLRPKVVVTS